MKAKILIVDDEAQFRALLKADLEDADYIVTEAEDGAALRKVFPRTHPTWCCWI